MTTTKLPKCPHCGNVDQATIEHNGCKRSDPALTFLCVAPCDPNDSTFDHIPKDDPARTVCGMQWSPAEYDRNDASIWSIEEHEPEPAGACCSRDDS